MKKITGLLSIIFAFIFTIVLASCSSTSGVEVEKNVTATTSSITFELTFARNENLENKTASPYIKAFNYDETKEDNIGTYVSKQDCTFSGVYTSSTVTFTSLTKGAKYVFRFYVTYNQSDELIATWVESTLSDNKKEIKTVDDFLAMKDDRDGEYTLMNDIDFSGEKLTGLFNSSSQSFTGVFNGNGYTISNFLFESSDNGIFGYTKDALIKNVKIVGTDEEYLLNNLDEEGNPLELVNGNFGSRSDANIGTLVGNAENTEFVDVTIDNVNLSLKGNNKATLKVGGVVGLALNCSFTNVKATNISITSEKLCTNVYVGLFAGAINGDALETDNGTYTAKNTSASGEIKATLSYGSYEGNAYIGGYAGDLGSSGLVSESYTDADITLYRDPKTSNSNKFSLVVGGFAAGNLGGSMWVDGCVAAADIKVVAGSDSTTLEDAALSKLCTKTSYFGGFVGVINKHINRIENSCYVKKSAGLNVYALESETDEESNVKTLIVKNNVYANKQYDAILTNLVCANDDAFDTSVLASEVSAVVAKYLA
ncbi:hypothetical protein EI71_00162 [Anaeroplasma bactoclasticum]|jgi:uncharacterized protein YegJ (DUF2314 family)|uniref:GLUG motif-containing protein n=1 Tax=Anaeroplasma bactoclasticum TaxID=2088 RepID=A0A397S777_9MOLU|nr:hypothetical protein [Anaeroplasma bactoclasticum]RIA78601.1 hypothetical protein EI71_00162 [Anaeroplasma bactoclasticum]